MGMKLIDCKGIRRKTSITVKVKFCVVGAKKSYVALWGWVGFSQMATTSYGVGWVGFDNILRLRSF